MVVGLLVRWAGASRAPPEPKGRGELRLANVSTHLPLTYVLAEALKKFPYRPVRQPVAVRPDH